MNKMHLLNEALLVLSGYMAAKKRTCPNALCVNFLEPNPLLMLQDPRQKKTLICHQYYISYVENNVRF